MLFPVPNQVNDWRFLEVWIDVTASPPYILMLLGNYAGSYYIVDPAKAYQIIFIAQTYQEAKLWLLEDEYEHLDGQLILEEQHSPLVAQSNIPVFA